MKIKTIEIRDFRGISNVTIDNLDKNLNLLIGVNGAGKSSVLEAIALILEPYTARLTIFSLHATQKNMLVHAIIIVAINVFYH